jgi:hypothetical protein
MVSFGFNTIVANVSVTCSGVGGFNVVNIKGIVS